MSETVGVGSHPYKAEMENLWKQGHRAGAIVEWLQENGYPLVKEQTLGRYGQRNWSEKIEVPFTNALYSGLLDEDDPLRGAQQLLKGVAETQLGDVQRISVSKTGYSISLKPELPADPSLLEIDALPRYVMDAPIPKRKASKVNDINVHVVIPDTQVDPGRPSDHLLWISQYLHDRYHDERITLVHVGDHWNMGSLSSYDRGKGAMEGRRYLADIEAGNRAFEVLDSAIRDEPKWDKHFLFGNHENRIARAVEDDIRLEGLITLDHCITPPSWIRHGFLEPVWLDGVCYSHYFYNPNTGRPYGGENAETRLKTIGHSFVMGHQQGLKQGMRYSGGRQQVGVIAGSCYQHEEDYLGPQGNAHWRGIVVLNNVEDGSFDTMPVSLDYLCRRYEGHRLSQHKGYEV